MQLDSRYQRILESSRPFLVAHKSSLPHLNLAPLGKAIEPECIFDPVTLRSREIIDGLHALDSATFGPEDMLMPRWVLFDCGEMPGIVFGFLHRLGDLPEAGRRLYTSNWNGWVPISMWVAIPCVEPGAWFGHNLSSVNVVQRGSDEGKLSGLAMLTKVMGISAARVQKQQGITQWDSRSVPIHARIGDMLLLSAWTPAHTYPASLCYCIHIQPERLADCLREGAGAAPVQFNRKIDPNDEHAIQSLHAEIEAGAKIYLTGAERDAQGDVQRILLRE